MAAGTWASCSDAKADLVPDVISCNADISGREKGEQWQRALTLLAQLVVADLVPGIISYNAAISACERVINGSRHLAFWG